MNKKIETVFTSKGLLHGGRLGPKGQLLLAFHQKQELIFEVQTKNGGIESLRGPLEQVHWQELEFTMNLAREAICRSGLLSSELMMTESLIVLSNSGWNPVLELRLRPSVEEQVDLPRISAVVVAVLQGILAGIPENSEDLIAFPLLDVEKREIRSVVKEGLSRIGGRRISQALEVVIDNQVVGRVEGKFASKPDHSNFHAQLHKLVGRFVGFDVDVEALYFLDMGQGRVEINYGKQAQDFMMITRLCIEKMQCVVRVNLTTDRRGRSIYSMVCVDSTFAVPSILEDSSMMEIKTIKINS